jgi:anti-sigma B factor antagonist
MYGFSSPGDMLGLDVQAEDGTVLVRCAGELDLSVCDRLREAIAWSYTRDLRALRVDLSALSFMDSSGLACLIDTKNRCHDLGVRFDVVPSEMVAGLLDLTDAPITRAAPEPPVPCGDGGIATPPR